MFAVSSVARKSLRLLTFLLLPVLLAACEPLATGGGGPSINTRAPVPVALLVPAGSGETGDDVVASSLENAARLAISDLDGIKIDLRVYHTGGQADQAAAMATKAVNDGAKIILGPVFAHAANAAGVAVARRNVNVLSFSNNPTIAGGNVFVLGNTFQNTANRLVGYAVRQGKDRIEIVHARTTAGDIGRDAIEGAIGRNGATLTGVQSYEFSQNGVISAASVIARDVAASGANAVFFTSDTAGALPLLTQFLPEQGVDPTTTQFIGLTRWDIPANTLSLPGVQGGWFALPDPAMSAQFRARYNAAFGQQPHPLAGLAYDGIAAIGALVKAGKSDALTKQALTQASGFVGVNGVFRLRADGTNERGLAVAQIQNSQVVVIDPAPRSFGGAGF